MYYDLTRHKAIAINATLEAAKPTSPDQPAVIRAAEMQQISENEFVAKNAKLSASRLPSDPQLVMTMAEVVLTQQENQVRRTIFGFAFIDRETGNEIMGTQQHFEAKDATVSLSGVPFFYLPKVSGDPSDPLGPFKGFSFGENNIDGVQAYTTWDMLQLIGIKALPS